MKEMNKQSLLKYLPIKENLIPHELVELIGGHLVMSPSITHA